MNKNKISDLILLDTSGAEIKPGQTVETRQHGGGVLPPGEPRTGIAEACLDAFNQPGFQIRFREPKRDFDQFVLITHQINTILNP
jgi:hypothetical protein